MREYLFELRKKANKTQEEIDKVLFEKYRITMKYTGIETGRYWKNISEDRAKVLADVLGSTPEYIMDCDKKYGGYEGKYRMHDPNNIHMIRNGRRNEYDMPLTEEEKIVAEQYLPYAEKIINFFRQHNYRCFFEKRIITYEDFYDIGVIAFLRSVKALSIKKVERADYMNSVDNMDAFYRYSIRLAIKGAYSKYIRSELTFMRKDYHSAQALDLTLDSKNGVGAEIYNFVPSDELPIPIEAESSWILNELYKYLNERQIKACKLLISEWTVPEIVKGGYATKTDIGVIRFYLAQFKRYGKILWKAEDFKSESSNVRFSFITNRWQVKTMYKTKAYSLGEYTDLNTALDLHNILHMHLEKGDFLQWYEHHRRPNSNSRLVFTYPLPDGPEIADFQEEAGKRRGGAEIIHSTKETPAGVNYDKRRNSYHSAIGHFCLGYYKTFDEALAIRQLAEEHYHSSDFETWYSELQAERDKLKITYTRMDKHCRNGKITYAVLRNFERKQTNLGRYPYEEALLVKAEADKHIDAGDFDEWAQGFYAEYKERAKSKRVEALKKTNKTRKAIRDNAVLYAICKYVPEKYLLLCYAADGSNFAISETADIEEAYKTMDLANEHIEAGDFDVWFADYKKINGGMIKWLK